MSKEKLIEEMAKVVKEHIHEETSMWKVYEVLYNAGYRKQSEGHWITTHCTNGGKSPRGRTIIYKTFTCDVCNKSNGRRKTNFCPNCGAKMKGGE